MELNLAVYFFNQDDGIEGHVDETTSTFDLWPPAVLDPNDFYGTQSTSNESFLEFSCRF